MPAIFHYVVKYVLRYSFPILLSVVAFSTPLLYTKNIAESAQRTADQDHVYVPSTTPTIPPAIIFEKTIQDWEALTEKAERFLIQPIFLPKRAAAIKRDLRVLRSTAGDIMREAEKEVERQKELLTALGSYSDTPNNENVTEEVESVKNKREEIEKTIAAADARAKQANLFIAKANELLDKILKLEQEKQKERLLTHHIDYWSGDYYINVFLTQKEALTKLTEEGLGKTTAFFSFAFLSITVPAIILFFFFWRANQQLYRNGITQRPVSAFILLSSAFLAIVLIHVSEAPENSILIEDTQILLTAIISTALAISTSRCIKDLTYTQEEISKKTNTPKRLALTILVLAIGSISAGYVHLGAYITLNIYMLYLGAAVFLTARESAEIIGKKRGTQPGNRILSPLTIALLEPILAIACLLLPLYFLGVAPGDIYDWLLRYREGFSIGSVKIQPLDIVVGGGAFLLLLTLTKFLQWFFAKRVFPHTRLEASVCNASLTMIGYSGAFLAILTLLGTLGINTSNLAIVAGAFTVGIGFGLQSIFNNFVSGIILLLERPLRVGDWISVGKIEGTVKQIRVRSTSIESFQQADFVVPNTLLITEIVQNWTLRTLSGRIDIPVTVSYKSDPDLVTKILYDIISTKEEAIAYPQPIVLLANFNPYGMLFEARVHIRDIRDKPKVESEIRLAILKEFRKHDIYIPVPQYEVALTAHKSAISS